MDENTDDEESCLALKEYKDILNRPYSTVVWYDEKTKNQHGVLHMYPRELFEVEDLCMNSLPPESSGLLSWMQGMNLDIHPFTSRSDSIVDRISSHSLSSEEYDQIYAGARLSRSGPSEDEGYLESTSSSSRSVFESLDVNDNSVSPLINWEDYCQETEDVYAEKCFEDHDSLYHTDGSCELFLEMTFSESTFLLCGPDVASLLIGISSDSFYIRKSGSYLHVFIGGNNQEASNLVLSDFVTFGSYFVRLYDFSHNSFGDGSIKDALKHGVAEYLRCYESAIVNTLVYDLEHINALKYKFEKLGNNLRHLGNLCGFKGNKAEQTEIQAGLELIDYLYEAARGMPSDDFCATLMFMIKHAFSPYLGFLQSWLFEGVCRDSSGEFRLQKNSLYEEAKDETYWLSCYTTPVEELERFTPVFLKGMALDILVCGKSFNLLKRCCPEHHIFCVDLPAPSFEIGFSKTVIQNIHKKSIFAMLDRIACMLESLERKRLFLDDNQLDADVEEKKRLSLLEFKCEIERTANEIFPGELSQRSKTKVNEPSEVISLSDSDDIYPKYSLEITEKEVISAIRQPLKEELAIDLLIDELMKRLYDNPSAEDKEQLIFQNISSLITLSLHPLIKAQIDMVNKSVLDHFLDVLKINDHFMALTNFFCLRNGEFGHSLHEQLLSMVDTQKNSSQIVTGARLHVILSEALANSVRDDSVNSTFLKLQTNSSFPCSLPNNLYDVLKLKHITLHYEVQWPCNIIITNEQMVAYNSILKFLLELQHVLSALKDMWFYFKQLNGDRPELIGCCQYRILQYYRHEMQHFAVAFKSCVGSEVLEIAWNEFQRTLKEGLKNLEDLRTAHLNYVSTVIKVCLLNKKSAKVSHILRDVFKSVSKFSDLLINHTWEFSAKNCQYEHGAIASLHKEFKNFQENIRVFHKVLKKSVHQKFRPHYWERLLLMVDYNFHYKQFP